MGYVRTTNVVLPLSYFYAKLWYLPQENYCVYNPLDNPPVKNQRFLPAPFAQGAFLDCTTSKKKNRVFITQVRYEHSTCLPGTKKWPALKAHPQKVGIEPKRCEGRRQLFKLPQVSRTGIALLFAKKGNSGAVTDFYEIKNRNERNSFRRGADERT